MLLPPRSASPTESYNSNDSSTSSIASQSGSEPGDIKDQILAALEESAVGNHKFLPADKLEALVTRDVVTVELEFLETESEDAELETYSLASLAEYVLEKAKRVFLILAHNENLKNLPSLVHDGFTDSDLPIHKARDGQRRTTKLEKRRSSGLEKTKMKAKPAKSRYIVCSIDEASNRCKSEKWTAFSAWLDAEIELFDNTQWMCLAPIFTKDKFQYHLHPQRPLPFILKSSSSKSGFFSKVYQVTIHAAHHNETNDGQPLVVALKEMSQEMEAYYYKKEADTLAGVRQLQHPHVIKPIATYQNGETNCFLFPWADGGNLQEFWQETDAPINGRQASRIYREPGFILWVLEQVRGLSDGLRTLYDRNCRHGDLKPENILRLKRSDSQGVLLIADMGLAKFHIQATRQRIARSSTSEGTFRYAPPEMSSNEPNRPLSRDYDVWSMGCILLEFLIWLLEGQPGLREFYHFGNESFDKFWEYKDDKYQVHNIVRSWIHKLSQQLGCEDERVDTALKRVLQLVEGRLLVVDLEGDVPVGHTCRANANQLFHCLDEIYKRAKNDPGFLYDGSLWRKSRQSISSPASLQLPNRNDIPHRFNRPLRRAPTESENSDGLFQLTVDAAPDNNHTVASASQRVVQEQLSKLNDIWESKPDNEFVKRLLTHIDLADLRPPIQEENLCDECINLDIWSPGFKFTRALQNIRQCQQTCGLCRLFNKATANLTAANHRVIQFIREESTFKLDHTGPPILSIYVDPESADLAPRYAQRGFPQLPKQGSQTQLALLKEWLRVCDETHDCQTQQAKLEGNRLPTRVLDVGSKARPHLRLLDGVSGLLGQYLALSHRWGKLDESQKLCTYKRNLLSFKEHIDFGMLPRTFQDAVRITRGLGIQYLWIDSICIIQDDAEDWDTESGRMEDVFSSAYCTLAASSSKSSVDGFLQTRPPRDFATLRSDKSGTVYICEAIDNFHLDVEKGELNKRGWVLQERALSRRSIHFTGTQIYWECGEGVHCETMTKLLNSKAAFLGDSDFPNSALDYFKGGRIVLFQSLYEIYSRLAFTRQQDRSVAISGLEKRLVRTFETKGGYGVFEEYLSRGLLWQRPEGGTLTRINYPAHLHIPSWSWMAYSGPISYMTIPFGGVDWTDNFKSPFKWDKMHWETNGAASTMDLDVLASKMAFKDRLEMLKRIRFDENSDIDIEALRCVIIGKGKVQGSEGPMLYALIIKRDVQKSTGSYVRVGAGCLHPLHVSKERGIWVRIC